MISQDLIKIVLLELSIAMSIKAFKAVRAIKAKWVKGYKVNRYKRHHFLF